MRKGFTLIELMLVISIVGILIALFIPVINKILGKDTNVNVQTLPPTMSLVEAIAKEDRSGRSEPIAITNGYEIRVAFEYDGVRVYKFNVPNGRYECYFSKEIR